MPRRYLNRWMPWLLALIVLRAFVPVGFMLSVRDGGLALTLCPGSAPAAAAAMAQAEHHHHAQAAHAHHSASHGDMATDMAGQQHDGRASPCPYALTTTACGVEPPTFLTAFERPLLGEITFDSGFISRSFLRADRIRGPPVYA